MKKIPIVKQRDLRDCGPCCIQSILKYYGGYVSLENIRQDCYTDNKGTSAYHLVETLKKYGFDSCGLSVDKNHLNDNDIVLPVICHLVLKNGLHHYVVLYKITPDKIVMMDPKKGVVKMSKEDFFEIFDGILVSAFPNSNYIETQENNSLSNFLIVTIKNNVSNIIKILILSFLGIILSIINNLYFKMSFNNMNSRQILNAVFISFMIIIIIKNIIDYITVSFKNKLVKDIDYKLNTDFFKKLFYLPSKVIKNRTVGEIVTRVSELNNLHEIVNEIVITIAIDIFLIIASFIVLYFISIMLLKVLLVFVWGFVLICFISNKLIYKMIRRSIESNEEYNDKVIENIEAFNTIKNNNIENKAKFDINLKMIKYIDTNYSIGRTMNKINTLKRITLDLLYFVIITVGINLILKNKLSIVDFITFESILVYLIDPIRNIMELMPKLSYLKASLEKVLDFLSLDAEKQGDESDFINGDITIENLSYSYNDYYKNLDNINLKIKKNDHVMLKGKSGVGKSTLCKLINRTYKLDNGQIKISNINIYDYSLKTIKDNILYLSQNEYLFNDTIKNNIILDQEYDVKKFNKICDICNLEEIVLKKPFRYNTTIDKDFSNISGGEKQRIILARALYRNFSILILDEALSEVNEKLEQQIIKNINDYFKDKTIIYVTHKQHDKLFDKTIEIY